MGNCHSRLCCTAIDTEDTSPKTYSSEASPNSEENSARNGNSVDASAPRPLCDRLKKFCRRRKSKKKKSKSTDQEDFILELRRSVRKDFNDIFSRAREINLALRQNPDSTIPDDFPQSWRWLVDHPRLFDSMSLHSDEEDGVMAESRSRNEAERSNEPDSVSQELAAELAACMPEGGSLSTPEMLFSPVSAEDDCPTTSSGYSWSTSELSDPPSPRPGTRTRVIRRRRDSVEGMVSSSESEMEENELPRVRTTTSSPESPADRPRGFIRSVFDRVARRVRSNRVHDEAFLHDVAFLRDVQTTYNSVISGHPQSPDVNVDVNDDVITPQSPRRSPLMRAWLDILGRNSPPSNGGLTQILVRPYDENQTKKGCKLQTTVTTDEVLTSFEQRPLAGVEVPATTAPPHSAFSSVTSFQCEDDLELCSLASSSISDARPTDFGGT